MKVKYTAPAKEEIYLVGKNEARRVVRSLFPEVEFLAFETRHGPNMSPGVPYLATFAWSYIRILSIRPEFAVPDLIAQFRVHVLPHICKTAKRYLESGVRWPRVIVAVDHQIHQVCCSDGWLFPSLDEIKHEVRKTPKPICTFQLS